ncbi:outer membrane usher protein [Klebsiella oxytoca]|uniref:Outer membrane usher protein n=1 Tax=Klebsiella oxytoca TaxID=571 RepID=A0A318FPU4_KLEOX|nr:fimbria/pilus outer membrane usher protein [Klebsiella oxytoca]PXW44361.1 outer membrane usher protein [Klebsiella oxytoca]
MHHLFQYSLLAIAIMAAITKASWADESTEQVTFDPEFLNVSGGEVVDLTRFEYGASALPGKHLTEVYVNGEQVTHEMVLFVEQEDKRVVPCLSGELLKSINFNYSKLPAVFSEALNQELACYPLATLIPQAKMSYDSGFQRLDISVPQAMMNHTAKGYVSPERWDSGIPALLFGYNASTYTTRSGGISTDSSYAGINAGLNVGAWYFRHDGSYNYNENSGSTYQSTNNFVQRDISRIKGRLIVGEMSTSGQVFDTLPFKGVEVASDDRMLPQSKQGYAPDIRGIARTNARVTVYQNSRVIYETTVTPGAFVIDDLNPTGYGGDLDVKVTEADGSVQSFLVPYASVAQLLRPGAYRYDFVVGKSNDSSLRSKPELYMATWQHGLTNSLTGYGGVQGSGDDYYSAMIGVAISTPIGAFSTDATQARVHLDSDENASSSGQSYRLSYSKFLPQTNSNLTIAAYRYTTSGYYDYSTAMRVRDELEHHGSAENIWRPKNRFNITVNQGLSENWGQVYATGYTQDYWNEDQSDLQYQVGYSNSWRTVNYSLSAARVRSGNGNMETNWLFSLTMPLGAMGDDHVPVLNANLSHDSNGRAGEQVGISGNLGKDNQFNYNVTGINYNQGTGSSMSLSSGYRSPFTHMTATYGTGKDYQTTSIGMTGTVIAWQNGLVMIPYTGNTFAVVEAKGAKGAKVGGYSGIRIDRWGHAAIPYLNPYEMNEITIDPKGISYDVELENTSVKVAPYAGAVSKIVFKTKNGTPLLITALRTDGGDVPFGADVLDSKGNSIGSVGQMGQIYARVEQQRDTLTVKWGNSAVQRCQVNYLLTPQPNDGSGKNNIVRIRSVCVVQG